MAEAERYVRKAMLNLHLDRVRRRRVWLRLVPLVAAPAHQDFHEVVTVRAELIEAIRDLPARQRACVVLHYYLDLSVREISEQLGVGAGTVKRLLHEARSRLTERLAPSTHGSE